MNLGQLADALGLPAHGDPAFEVASLAPIYRAGPQDLSFVVSSRYAQALANTKAGAVIIPAEMHDERLCVGNYLISKDPYLSYAKASWLINPAEPVPPGIHPSAIVHQDACVGELASIGAHVVIGAHSVVEDHVQIDAHCVVGAQVKIGERTRLFPRVTVYENVTIGTDCRIQSGAVIGSEGFGYAWSSARPEPESTSTTASTTASATKPGWFQIQQTGGVRISNSVHIGANSTIDCGAIDPTVIGEGVIIDNQVQIAHNVQIGEKTAIAGCVGIAGSTSIGSHCQIGGACNIVGHITIADGVVLNAASLVTRSIDEKGRYGSGTPLLAEHAWRRSFVNLGKLDALVKRVRRLERWSTSDKS